MRSKRRNRVSSIAAIILVMAVASTPSVLSAMKGPLTPADFSTVNLQSAGVRSAA
jgi:hypothetical protein